MVGVGGAFQLTCCRDSCFFALIIWVRWLFKSPAIIFHIFFMEGDFLLKKFQVKMDGCIHAKQLSVQTQSNGGCAVTFLSRGFVGKIPTSPPADCKLRQSDGPDGYLPSRRGRSDRRNDGGPHRATLLDLRVRTVKDDVAGLPVTGESPIPLRSEVRLPLSKLVGRSEFWEGFVENYLIKRGVRWANTLVEVSPVALWVWRQKKKKRTDVF